MKNLVAWFAHNPIAANLLMILIVIGGFTSMPLVDKEFFPERQLNRIQVDVLYPGAGPAEVETQICRRIEEAVSDLDGIKEIVSTAREGIGQLRIEVARGYDSQRLLNGVKSRIDALNTLPREAERPQVSEILWKSRMMSIALAGNIGEANLKELGERLREDLATLREVSLVELRQPRNYEISVEVSELDLRRYGLRFDDVVAAIRDSSLNLPAGKIRAEAGDIQLQTRGQGYVAQDFEQIVLLSRVDGTKIRVGDVATVIDGFEDVDVLSTLNGKPALTLDVYVTTEPDVLATSRSVRRSIEKILPTLPEGVELKVMRDTSEPFKGRLTTLVTNGISGLALVFVLLMIFLRPALAFWVSVGILAAFLGSIWLLPYTGVSLNMVSLFAFILILGILVDDAIIVGEAVHTKQEGGMRGVEGAVIGTQSVLKPVCFAVLSTMVFFVPFYFLPSDGQEARHIATVVLLALGFSLFESLFILPAHLGNMRPERPGPIAGLAALERAREAVEHGLLRFAREVYRPFLERCLAYRYLTVSVFLVALLLTISLLAGGWVPRSFFPRVPIDFVIATATLPDGASFRETRRVMERMEAAGERLRSELNRDAEVVTDVEAVAYGVTVRATLTLSEDEDRPITAREISRRWSDAIGPMPEVKSFDLQSTMIPLGKPIELNLSAPTIDGLRAAADELGRELARYPGVLRVYSSLEETRPEIEIRLKDQAELLGLSLADIARQVRRGFYGEEVQRVPRQREDVRVMVRYPEIERLSEDYLREMRIRTPDGREVPFEAVAEVHYVDSYRVIERVDRRRTAVISADVASGAEPAAIIAQIQAERLPQWQMRTPGLELTVEGERREEKEFTEAVFRLIGLSMIVIFGLMAVAFRSYVQPLLVLTAIPFGYAGSVLGHLLMGREISMFSLLGIVACAGVVVNDNLVLIDRLNILRADGVRPLVAVARAATDRFRAIVLTSVTTFVGMAPIMLERSSQAQFLIPMVISLSFGVLLATFVTLIFVPALYGVGVDLAERFRRIVRPARKTDGRRELSGSS